MIQIWYLFYIPLCHPSYIFHHSISAFISLLPNRASVIWFLGEKFQMLGLIDTASTVSPLILKKHWIYVRHHSIADPLPSLSIKFLWYTYPASLSDSAFLILKKNWLILCSIMQYSWCLNTFLGPVCSFKSYFGKLVVLFYVSLYDAN